MDIALKDAFMIYLPTKFYACGISDSSVITVRPKNDQAFSLVYLCVVLHSTKKNISWPKFHIFQRFIAVHNFRTMC
jgi:hypothetical protein